MVQKSTKVMCEEILQLYSSQYSSESLAIKILLSTTDLFSSFVSYTSAKCLACAIYYFLSSKIG